MNGDVLRPHRRRGCASRAGRTINSTELPVPNQADDLPTHIAQRRKALTVSELAEILSVSNKQVYALIQQGYIPSYRIGGSIRLDPGTTARWLRERAI